MSWLLGKGQEDEKGEGRGRGEEGVQRRGSSFFTWITFCISGPRAGDKWQISLSSIFYFFGSISNGGNNSAVGKVPYCFYSHIQFFWHQLWGVVFPTPTNSSISAGCLTIQFNSDTNQSLCKPHRLRAQSHKTVHPHFKYQSQVAGPQSTHNLSSWLQIRNSHDLVLGFARTAYGTQKYFMNLLHNKEYDKGYRWTWTARWRDT